MTIQEFKQRREQLNRRLLNTRKQLDRLEKDFIKSLPFRYGDMISVNGSFAGWLFAIECQIYDWRIYYYPMKLDGSRSGRINSVCCQISDVELFKIKEDEKE